MRWHLLAVPACSNVFHASASLPFPSCLAAKRYLRSDRAEAAARNRAAASGASEPESGFDAAQCAAFAHALHSSDDDDFV